MTTAYTHFLDPAKEVQPPEKGILSRTLYAVEFTNDFRTPVLVELRQPRR
jgi:hypothetical protein